MKMDARINELFRELVPETGKADSLAGELVRAACRLGYRFYNDGDMVGVGYGNETCNAAARFLEHNGDAKIVRYTQKLTENNYDERKYEYNLCRLTGAVADYVEQNPSLRQQETVDMNSYYDPKLDVDDSWLEEDEDNEEEY